MIGGSSVNKIFNFIIPIIVSSFLICLIYMAYFFVLPPFYYLHSIGDSDSTFFTLTSGKQENFWICPAPGHYPLIFLSEDLTFDLNFSVSSDLPVNVYLYAGGHKMLEKNGTRIDEALSQRVPLNFPRLPGEWIARIQPPKDGFVLYAIIENASNENTTTVHVSYSVISYYRLGSLLNFALVIVSAVIIGFTLLILLIQSMQMLAKHISQFRQ